MSSNALQVHFHFDPPLPAADELLCRMAQVVRRFPQVRDSFAGLDVSRKYAHIFESETVEPLDVEQLCKAASGRHAPDVSLSTHTSLQLWRFEQEVPQTDSIGLKLTASGDQWVVLNYLDRRISGEATLTLETAGPYYALLEDDDHPRRDEINAKVEENLENLTQLLFASIEELKPRSVKLYTEGGLNFALNSHLVYFRDESVVLDDLAFVAELWERGVAGSTRPVPLAQAADPDADYLFHSDRTPEMRTRLQQDLSKYVHRYRDVTKEDVARALQSKRFDNYTLPVGGVVLEYPHVLNAFVDRFYLELLAGKPL